LEAVCGWANSRATKKEDEKEEGLLI
jgi:hypothetical protein